MSWTTIQRTFPWILFLFISSNPVYKQVLGIAGECSTSGRLCPVRFQTFNLETNLFGELTLTPFANYNMPDAKNVFINERYTNWILFGNFEHMQTCMSLKQEKLWKVGALAFQSRCCPQSPLWFWFPVHLQWPVYPVCFFFKLFLFIFFQA